MTYAENTHFTQNPLVADIIAETYPEPPSTVPVEPSPEAMAVLDRALSKLPTVVSRTETTNG